MLLRLTAGFTLVSQGIASLAQGSSSSVWELASGGLTIAFSVSLMLGFITPIAATLAGLDVIGMRAAWLPESSGHIFDANLPTLLVAAIAASLAVLGPGAFSIDARLFGRREIIIRYPASDRR